MPDTRRISFENGISRKELNAVRQRFMKLHRERLRRIHQELRPSQQEFLELLPLLFHINHPMLPGFVSSDTVTGIPDYSPSRQALEVASRLSRSFQYKKRAQRIYHIQGLYLMGSTGTIGQSFGSDFDLWLCHNPSIDQNQRKRLQKKVELIEKSATELGLEVHIFLVDPERFRRGEKSRLSHESSGTTQHYLLLEEFYRSAVLLAGRYPLWWLVPPEHEHDYQAYVEYLLSHRFIKATDVFDLGGLNQIEAGEFFGAALWQLYKGIDSPYKAVLKIFLMEAYSRHYPQPQWLAQQAKEAIYSGEADIDMLDAYILLYQKVEEYLKSTNDKARLELARRCFYFKVGERLSQLKGERNWRSRMLLKLTRQWGWGQAQLQILDSRSEWKIDQVIKERNALVSVLTRSYRLLTDFAKKFAKQSHIDPHELNLLGRKLYTALDHRPGKIDHINPGISKNLSEEHLSLYYQPTREGSSAWMLYRSMREEQDLVDQRPIKISKNLIEILLWSHVNQVWVRHSRVSLDSAETGVSRKELLSLQRSIVRLFPALMPRSADMKTLAKPAYAVMVGLFINIGTDPMEYLTKEGKQLTSERHDPLSFASARTNLAINLEKLIQTSWGELQVTRHDGSDGLMDVLCHILDLQSTELTESPQINAFSFSSVRGSQIALRVTELFNHVAKRFQSGDLKNGCYLFRMGQEFYMVQHQEKGYTWRMLDSFDSLLEELMQPQPLFRRVEFDREILADSPYPTLFAINKPDVIQLYYQVNTHGIDLYILDEQGSLFQQALHTDNPRFLMLQQRRFFNSLLQLRNLLTSSEGDLLAEPEFYQLKKDKSQKWHTIIKRAPLAVADDYMEVTLVTDSTASDAKLVSLMCGEREFTQLEYSDGLYSAAANYIHSFRKGAVKYPIYITSIRLSGFQTQQSLETTYLLNLKKRIEAQLNENI
ncbi:MAG: class I adenylate cyclase [Candidatus Thiodiazotropha sp.]|jgi:adenylate cyclase, class 1